MKLKFQFTKKTILFISDCHIPYHHKDLIAFLRYLKKKYKPDLIVCLGDLLDFHDLSFHDSDPALDSAMPELIRSRKVIKEIEKLFPEMIIVGSNHGDLPLRKAFAAGIPGSFIKSYNDIYGVGKGWQFVDDLMIVDKEKSIYVAHGITKNALKLAQQRGVNHVCGHYHCQFKIEYVSNPRDLLWGMNAGCLIDSKALAFAYNKLQLNRPVIGTGLCVNGEPMLEPMQLDKHGRWVG